MNIEEIYIRKEEKEMLRHLINGDSTHEAAKKMNKNTSSLFHWVRDLIEKFKVKNRKELLEKVRDMGIVIMIFFLPVKSFSQNHILGGRINYYVIDTTQYDSTIISYLITLRLYTRQPQFLPDSAMITLWNLDTDSIFAVRTQVMEGVFDMPEMIIPCAPYLLAYKFARYSWTVDLPPNTKGWYAAWQGRCD